MSQSIILPPVHDTSPPPFDDDVDDNDIIPTIQNHHSLSSDSTDQLNNSNDDWKSVDDNNDTDINQIQDDIAIVNNENISKNVNIINEEKKDNNNNDDDDAWANFATFENKIDEVSETPITTTSAEINMEENLEDDWANFGSNSISSPEEPIQASNFEPNRTSSPVQPMQLSNNEQNNIEENLEDDWANCALNTISSPEEPIQSSNLESNTISSPEESTQSSNLESNIISSPEQPMQLSNDEQNNIEESPEDDWANFASNTISSPEEPIQSSNFESTTITSLEQPIQASTDKQINMEENLEGDWANFASNTVSSPEEPIQSFNDEQTNKVIEDDDDDDFGEFSEVQVAPKPQTSSLPTDTLSTEQIDSLISTCFPMESSTNDISFISTELPSFTTYKDQTKKVFCLESSLSLWNVLSNISNDPIGIQFQWRKSNTERLFHQALGVHERFNTKSIPLTPEILQPEKLKSFNSTNSESENINNENKLSTETIRPHFDWKQSGLENPLTDTDSSSLSSIVSKNEDYVFDANKTLDLDFYVPSTKSSNDEEQIISSSSIQRNDSPIIQQKQQRHSIPIKTMDLYSGSITTLNDDAKRIIDTLPNLSFMSAKALMFPIRFNTNNNDESTTLY